MFFKPKFDDMGNPWRKFLFQISLIILLFISVIYLGVFFKNKQLIENEILMRSRVHFETILLTRRWNAQFGGVYIEKKPGIESNPYLKNPDIQTTDGKVYTKKNPALMTREISSLANEDGNFSFHITSLKPLNPMNAPDDFERDALTRFENGDREFYAKVKKNDQVFFRYIAPLYVEKSCLECHAEQGYKEGDVRGGISVTFDIDQIEKMIWNYFYMILFLGISTLLLLLGIIYFIVFDLVKKLKKAQQQLHELSITDELTQLHNRRFVFSYLSDEFKRVKRYHRPIGCMMIDIDHFKKINDTYGHQTGDEVLKAVADFLKKSSRQNDIVGRYGGEEFIKLLPETNLEQTAKSAEILRTVIESAKISVGDHQEIHVTVSIGVSAISIEQSVQVEDFNQMIRLADDQLYRAKANGRNRIEVANPE